MEARAALCGYEVTIRHRTVIYVEVGHGLHSFGRRFLRVSLGQFNLLGIGKVYALAANVPDEPYGTDPIRLVHFLWGIGARRVKGPTRCKKAPAFFFDTNINSDFTLAVPIVRIVAQNADGEVEAECVPDGLEKCPKP